MSKECGVYCDPDNGQHACERYATDEYYDTLILNHMMKCVANHMKDEAFLTAHASGRKGNEQQYYLKRAEETSKFANAWRRAIEIIQASKKQYYCTHCGLTPDDALGGACDAIAGPNHNWVKK